MFKFWSDEEGEAEAEATPGAPVADGFVYSSDRNDDWMDGERLGSMLREVGQSQ